MASHHPAPPFHSHHAAAPSTAAIPLLPLHQSRNAAKIIKGEIHNVLTVMRADPRYYYTTTGKVEGSSRFEYEERQQSVGMSRRFWGNQYKQQQQQLLLLKNRGTIRRWDSDAAFHNNNHWSTASGSFASHPILQGLRDLYDLLSAVESTSEGSTASIDNHHQYHHPLNAVTFVSPFAAAVCSKDVDAKTTGAALSALHKFIVYGFVGGHFDVHWQSTAYYSSVGGIVGGQSALPSSDVIRESITVVAQCIRHCSFEESDSKNASGGSKGMLSFWSSDKSQQKRGTSMLDQSVESGEGSETTTRDLPLFLVQPR
eukprot:scaffold2221_cov201-Alexandrium_tamarense.AAC.1